MRSLLLLWVTATFIARAALAQTLPLELYCKVENLERKCSDVRSVEAYRFVRTCVTSSLRNGGYVAFTDDYERASSVPSFCAGASPDQINEAIAANGGVHAARLLQMASELTFDPDRRFAALAGITMPNGLPSITGSPLPSRPSAPPVSIAVVPSPPVEPDQPPTDRRRPAVSPKSGGTGFVIGSGDVVITNAHVISTCSRLVGVAGAQEFEAKLIATDEGADLAALRLAKARLPALALSTAPEDLGGEIVVLGFPLTSILGNDLRVTTGVISSLSGPRGERKLMQVSAAVQPGNSGGPVIDQWGGVSGVVVAKLASRFSAENVNFAVRAPVVRSFLQVNGIAYASHKRAAPLRPADIARGMAGSVVMLQCF